MTGQTLTLVGAAMLLVFAILAPWAAGVQTERNLHNAAAHLAGDGVALEALTYDRGWLSAEARYTFRIDPDRYRIWLGDDPGAGPRRVIVEQNIEHGPFRLDPRGRPAAARVESRLILPTALETRITEWFDDAPWITLTSHITLLGTVETGFEVASGSRPLANGDDATMSWQAIEGHHRLSRDGRAEQLILGGTGIRVTQPERTLTVEAPALRGDFRHSAGGRLLGDLQLRAETVTSEPKGDGTPIRLAGPTLDTVLDQPDDGLTLTLDGTLEGWTRGEAKYGPGSIQAAVRRIDSAAYDQLGQSLAELRTDPEALTPQALREMLERLLSGEPELHVQHLHLLTPDGPVDGEGRATFMDSPPMRLDQLPTLFRALDANFGMALPQPLLRVLLRDLLQDQLPPQVSGPGVELILEQLVTEQIEAAQRAGLITEQETRYYVRFALREGRIHLGGEALGRPDALMED